MVEPKSTSRSRNKNSDTGGISTARIRTIMKSTDDTEKIGNEGLHLMTKATEIFIQYLAKNSITNKNETNLKYEHLANLVNNEENLEFLLQIIPQKITVKTFKEILAKGDKNSDESSSEESEEEETESQPKKSNKK